LKKAAGRGGRVMNDEDYKTTKKENNDAINRAVH